ncbi:dimethylarginine dimethylaminohydrolase family protein [Virgibacillus kimchii]
MKKVITVPPLYMQIKETINETQRFYIEENIDRNKALRQHSHFIQVLKDEGIEVIELPAKKNLPEQIFTRDIGFVTGSKLFISSMATPIRSGETAVLKNWLEALQVHYQESPFNIEGGDVIIDEDRIWIGQSKRTSPEAIENLTSELPDYTIHTVHLKSNILHLDCAFNIIDHETAITYPPAIDEDAYKYMCRQFKVIEVTSEEQFLMGPNVLSIGNKTIISLPENKKLNHKLRTNGFKVKEVPFSEIIKSSGSFRCCTLPLVREKSA